MEKTSRPNLAEAAKVVASSPFLPSEANRPEPLLYTYSQAGKVLCISEHTVKKYVKLKKIKATPIGRAKRISKAELERIAREGLAA